MDEQRLREIIREVLLRVSKEGVETSEADSSLLPKAYFIFPKDWHSCDSAEYIPALKAAEGKYAKVIVLPKLEGYEERFSEVGAYTVTAYGDLCAPAEGSVTIFPIASRDLVIKTALCLSEDFEGCWVRRCIENGLPVYMKKEKSMFTGKEPAAYRKKILSYYQDVKSYGICFAEDENPDKKPSAAEKVPQKVQTKARFITTRDLRDIPRGGAFRIRAGDVLTALAKECIEELDIQIVEE